MERTFNPEILSLGRKSRGLTQSQLAQKMGVSQVVISKIEKGLLSPSQDLLEKLSENLYYPITFFYKAGEIYPSTTPFYRKRQSLRKHLREKSEAIANIICIHARDLLQEIEFIDPKIKMYDLDNYKNKPEEVAKDLRRYWVLPRETIKNITELIEDSGIIVIPMNFETPLLDGFTLRTKYNPPAPPIIFLNKDMPGERQRYTLAHELGHLVMHSVESQEAEEQAHRFAAEFLMPEEDIKGDFKRKITLQYLASLKSYWKVSMSALLKRASTLGAIDYNQSRYLWAQMAKLGYRTREPAALDIPSENPTLFQEIILTHNKKLGESIGDLCEILAVYQEDFMCWYGFLLPADMQIRLIR